MYTLPQPLFRTSLPVNRRWLTRVNDRGNHECNNYVGDLDVVFEESGTLLSVRWLVYDATPDGGDLGVTTITPNLGSQIGLERNGILHPLTNTRRLDEEIEKNKDAWEQDFSLSTTQGGMELLKIAVRTLVGDRLIHRIREMYNAPGNQLPMVDCLWIPDSAWATSLVVTADGVLANP